MIVWGSYPPRKKPARPVEKWDSPVALVAIAFWLAILLITPWVLDHEAATHPKHAGQQFVEVGR